MHEIFMLYAPDFEQGINYSPNFSLPIALTCMFSQNFPCQNFPVYNTYRETLILICYMCVYLYIYILYSGFLSRIKVPSKLNSSDT